MTIHISSRNSQPKCPRKKHRRTFFCSGERPLSKLMKWDLVYLLNTFENPSLRLFTAEKASPCSLWKSNLWHTGNITLQNELYCRYEIRFSK